MSSGQPGNDLSRWYHGASAAVECQDGCEYIVTNVTDAQALRAARRHVKETGHFVIRERTLYQNVRPIP